MFSSLPCLTDSRIHLFSGSYGSIIYLSCHRTFINFFSPRHKTVAINSDRNASSSTFEIFQLCFERLSYFCPLLSCAICMEWHPRGEIAWKETQCKLLGSLSLLMMGSMDWYLCFCHIDTEDEGCVRDKGRQYVWHQLSRGCGIRFACILWDLGHVLS